MPAEYQTTTHKHFTATRRRSQTSGARRLLAAGAAIACLTALLLGQGTNEERSSGLAMTKAAQAYLAALTEPQQKQTRFAYDDSERLNWHFIPRPRKGLPLKDLEGKSLSAAQRLIASGLSTAGYEQTFNVMSLEEILYLLETGDRAARRDRRDPQKYYVSIFGEPSEHGTWGWRLEGHHISLNYTIANGKVVATTPEFFGANPGKVDAGPGRTLRVLAPEEDLARQILKLCSPEQKKRMLVDPKAPGDIRGAGAPQPDTTPPVGLTFSEMNADQQKLLTELLGEYLKNMPADVERERTARIDAAKRDGIAIAWWGDSEVDKPHAYRVQGSTFLIEYNNTQNEANHIHSVWRDLAGDFNIPLKK